MTINDNGYIAALDVGDRRIGVAIASQVAKLPSAYKTIDRLVEPDVNHWIKQFIDKNDINELVVGLPRDINGNETEQTHKVKRFILSLEKVVSVPILTQDEALTSVDAERRLKSRGVPYSKADIDVEAACIILQDYLSTKTVRTA